jgi:hypothetical protein
VATALKDTPVVMVTGLASAGFLPGASSANSSISHAAAKMASSPSPAQTRCRKNDLGTDAPPVVRSTMNFEEGSFLSLRFAPYRYQGSQHQGHVFLSGDHGLRNSHEERADCAKPITGEVHVATQEPRWNGTAFWNRYTALIGPGYCDTAESTVSSVTPSTVACATKILSKGSL